MFQMGRELTGWVPPQFGRVSAVLSTAVAPCVFGTFLILILYWPLPRSFVGATIAGALFWIFAFPGVAIRSKTPQPQRNLVALPWADVSVAVAAVIMVRVFVPGIRLAH